MWFPAVIIIRMSIYTLISVVLHVPWTPGCFVVEHIKIWVFWLHYMQQIYCNFIFRMCKCTWLAKITFLEFIGIEPTKLSFVFIWMIQMFNIVMSQWALVSRTLLCFVKLVGIWAHFSWIGANRSSPILFIIMIIRTFFLIVIVVIWALDSLVLSQIQKLHNIGSSVRIFLLILLYNLLVVVVVNIVIILILNIVINKVLVLLLWHWLSKLLSIIVLVILVLILVWILLILILIIRIVLLILWVEWHRYLIIYIIVDNI